MNLKIYDHNSQCTHLEIFIRRQLPFFVHCAWWWIRKVASHGEDDSRYTNILYHYLEHTPIEVGRPGRARSMGTESNPVRYRLIG